MRVKKALEIDVQDIIHYVGSIPEDKYNCAKLARDTLRQALNQRKHVN
jgi:NifU-like protein involved in Fe-S cluster formation